MVEQPKTKENSATEGFNNEEIEKLRSLLGSLEKPSRACTLALSGKPPFSFCMNASDESYANSWIIRSGAIDHMTPTS